MLDTRTSGTVSRSIVGLLTAAVLAAVLVATAAPARAATSSIVAISGFKSLEVDPGTGRPFLSGDDLVAAYSPEGALLTTIDVPGASGLAFTSGSLWVAQTGTGSITRIDPVSLAKLGTYPTGVPGFGSIAAIGGKLWFVGGAGLQQTDLYVLDPATGVVSARGALGAGTIHAIPGSSTRLLTSNEPTSSVSLIDLTTDPVTRVATTDYALFDTWGSLAATEAGTWFAGTNQQGTFAEASLTPAEGALVSTGVTHRVLGDPQGFAYTPAHGGVLAVVTDGEDLTIARRGDPNPTHRFKVATGVWDNDGVAIAPDASRVYAASFFTSPEFGTALETFPLAPTVTSTTVTAIPQGRPTRTVVTGSGMGSITSATLGGQPVTMAHDGPDKLVLDITTAANPDGNLLALGGPLGDATVPITVVANPHGTLMGTITIGAAPVAQATVTVTDASGAARTTATGSDGTWSIADVSGGRYDLRVAKGASVRRWHDQELVGAGPWVYDADLQGPTTETLEQRRVALPPGRIGNLVTDPTSGRSFVGVGDEIVALDVDGRILRRIPEQWTATDLQVVGPTLYARLSDAGAIAVIDIPTLTVSRTIRLNRPMVGPMVIAGDRAVFVYQGFWKEAASVDLTTGVETPLGRPHATSPILAPIAGAPAQYLDLEPNALPYDPELRRMDGSTAVPQRLADTGTTPVSQYETEVAGSAGAGKAWVGGGKELDLATLQPTGATYPGYGFDSIAYSPGRGGVLAFNGAVSRARTGPGAAPASHTLPAAPTTRASSLDQAGDRSYVVPRRPAGAVASELVVADLAPIAAQVAPQPVESRPQALTVTGAGLGAATKVTIDGTSVPFTITDPEHLTVSAPGLAKGSHQLVVTTPWGASSPRAVVATAPYLPFSSWGTLVDRLYQDLTGRLPSAPARTAWIAKLTPGTKTIADLLESLRSTTDNTANVDPVVRLYRAFLQRPPDASGLRFWVGRKRAGSWSVTKMADSFAASNEFRTRYGDLSNHDYVARIYEEMLGRTADPSGLAFWTSKLDRKQRTRGQVMVGFSESSEYRRLQGDNTDAAVAYVFLLDRAPTRTEESWWWHERRWARSRAELAAELVASPAFAQRITG